MASTIVSNGTRASVVVKVRLPATCGIFSSTRRRRAKRSRSPVSSHVRPRTMSTLSLNMSLVEREIEWTVFESIEKKEEASEK